MQSPPILTLPLQAAKRDIKQEEQFKLLEVCTWHKNQHLIKREQDKIIRFLNDISLTDPSLSEKILEISVQFAGGHSNLRSTKRSLS